MKIRPYLLTLLTPTLGAQTLVEGYAATTRALPNGSANACLLSNGRVAYFTGTKLVLDDGASVRDLLTFPAPVYGSFTVEVGPELLLFGESSNGDIWLVPTNATARRLATLPFNYDATPWRPGLALVSAKTGASADNEIHAVDLSTGATDLVARVPGASGPVQTDLEGNLLYATASAAFPPPPGSSSLVRFAAAKLNLALGPGNLTLADAMTVRSGLDAASDLVLDADRDAFVVDWVNQRLLEIDDVDGTAAVPKVLLDYASAPTSLISLQMLPMRLGSAAVFEPFQPGGGGSMVLLEVSFTSNSAGLRIVEAARPSLAASVANPIPPGRFTLTVAGGPARGLALLVLGGTGPSGERPLHLLGTEQPIFWALAIAPGLELAAFPLPLDAMGRGGLTFANPGLGASLFLTAQAATLSPAALIFGSTPPLPLELR